MTNNNNSAIDYKSEIARKSIHLFSLSIPIGYYFLTKEQALTVLVPLTLFALIMDFGRYYSKTLGLLVYSVFGFMLREHEKDLKKKNLSGASYVFLSAVLVILLFPKIFVITGFTILIISDISAALYGRKFGKHKFLFKSLEGTLAFFVTASLVVLFSPKISNLPMEYIIGIIAAAFGAIAENISYGWADDNFTIPISVCGIMWLLYSWLLPGLNVYHLG
ncbi:MAG: diacylglycerol/polyprenol kinase family protein [Rhodothermaceae bacterium]